MEQKEKILGQREKVLAGCNGIPLKSLVKYVLNGVVTTEDLSLSGLLPEKLDQIELMIKEQEVSLWEEAAKSNTVDGYRKYLAHYPEGAHSMKAMDTLMSLEETFWNAIRNSPTKEGLEEYEKTFPEGLHVAECRMYLEDMPYVEVKKKNTITAYRKYMEEYPDKHTADILRCIEEIEDEKEWEAALVNNTVESFVNYLKNHDDRKRLVNHEHVPDARKRIENRSRKEIFLDQLSRDHNFYSASMIQEEIENGTATWADVEGLMGKEKTDAIKNWFRAEQLPEVGDPVKLPKGYTEVFFWGTKGTGKTCVIGSLLGSLENIKRNFIPIHSPAELHRQMLTNLFSGNNKICTLPDSTITTSLPAMPFRLRDERKRQHQLILVDMAGEAFTGIYKARNGISMTDDERTAVQKIEKYLLGKQRNETIHFFVIEYGSADKVVDPVLLPGITQINILGSVADYFQEKGIFRKSTVGVYVIITKCDRIPCPREDRARLASEYVSQMGTFVDNLKNEYAKKARVADFKKLSFSIGEVFAKNLCVFDDRDTDKIIRKLLLKSRWVWGEKLWEKIVGGLRNF